MLGLVLKNLEMFATLCGQQAMPNVIIATTMWGEVQQAKGERREQELKRDFWKDMIADGCRTERFKDTYESAWRIIGSLREKARAPVLLSHEIVDNHLRLNETQAGIALNKKLEMLLKDLKDAARRLQEQARNQNDELVVQELNKKQVEIEEKIRRTSDQLRELKIPMARRVNLLFKTRG
jgi:hypothetical protein